MDAKEVGDVVESAFRGKLRGLAAVIGRAFDELRKDWVGEKCPWFHL